MFACTELLLLGGTDDKICQPGESSGLPAPGNGVVINRTVLHGLVLRVSFCVCVVSRVLRMFV